MKKIYLVHCWDGTSSDGWYPWLVEKLSDKNVDLIKFDIPNTACPKIDEWVETLNSKVDLLNDETYFIGHSIGCQTILRYLETKGNNQDWRDSLCGSLARFVTRSNRR